MSFTLLYPLGVGRQASEHGGRPQEASIVREREVETGESRMLVLRRERSLQSLPETACSLCAGTSLVEFRCEGSLAIVRCQSCGLMFTEPQPKHEEIVALYSESYFHSDDARSMAYDDYLADGDNILRSSRRRLERIQNRC